VKVLRNDENVFWSQQAYDAPRKVSSIGVVPNVIIESS
jgi:hypothetical protein